MREPGQIIPIKLPLELKNKSLIGRVLDRGIIELNSKRLSISKKNRKSKSSEELYDDYQSFKTKIKEIHRDFCKQWMMLNPQEQITPKRRKIIEQIFDILLDLESTRQISESTIAWITKYSLETTQTSTSTNPEEFYLTASIGGDTGIPPGVEAYFIDPLQKLRCLNQLKQQGQIHFIPQFIIVSTVHAQAVENSHSKDGQVLNPKLHLYNSRVTESRIKSFIEEFFPELSEFCHLVEFPAYLNHSYPRLFFSVLYRFIPIETKILNKLFVIKGNVQANASEDIFKIALGNDLNPYIALHLFYNMIFSQANTLRFGSDATEAQFSLAATSLDLNMREKKEQIIEEFQDSLKKIREALSFTSIELNEEDLLLFNEDSNILKNIEHQLSAQPPSTKLHAQLGMTNVHATYYKHPLEPSLDEILRVGFYKAEQLREANRTKKAEKLEKTFARTIDYIGISAYFDFLKGWQKAYLPEVLEPCSMELKLRSQAEKMEHILLDERKSRQILNYYL